MAEDTWHFEDKLVMVTGFRVGRMGILKANWTRG
jgi:hypothetical protein